jgi:GH25 family lysozyme M1 (1,4-beta-N-acetylmuramidase)
MLLITFAFCRLGIDHSELTTVDQFKCLLGIDRTYAIYRAWKSYGAFDVNAPQSLANAYAAGFKVEDIGVYIFPCYNVTKTPEYQMQEMVKQLDAAGSKYSTIWLDVEINPSPSCAWTNNFTENCAFTERLANAGQQLGKKIGIYASSYMWNQIMGASDRCNKFVDLPLWYPHYDNVTSFSDFKPFGGWTKPDIKQYQGTVVLCGIDGVDLNYSL